MPHSHLAPVCYKCAPVVCSDLFFPMSAHLQSNWGGLLAGNPGMSKTLEPDGDKVKSRGRREAVEIISERNRTFLFLVTCGDKSPDHCHRPACCQNKQVVLGIFSLVRSKDLLR